jgi:hypothetical protein
MEAMTSSEWANWYVCGSTKSAAPSTSTGILY